MCITEIQSFHHTDKTTHHNFKKYLVYLNKTMERRYKVIKSATEDFYSFNHTIYYINLSVS